jgi:predicted DNA-binding transcriptional regulator AlpA
MIEMQNTFSEREAGKYLGVSAAVLRLWRTENKGPRYFKAGEKLIRYRKADLDSWIESRLSPPNPNQERVKA